MIEEKLIISFTEYLSCFDDEFGEYINDSAKENAEHCIKAINEAVNRFIAGVETIAHQGFNLNGNNFHARVKASAADDSVEVNLICDDCPSVSALYLFGATMNLVLTKSYNVVSIE